MNKTTAILLNTINEYSDSIKSWGIFEHEDHIMDEDEKKNTRPKYYLYVIIAKEEAQTLLDIAKPEVKSEINDGQYIDLIFKI